jgi:hypothetical protein
VVQGETDPRIRAEIVEQQKLIHDLLATGNAILTNQPVSSLKATAGERISTRDPVLRLRILSGLTSNVSLSAAREIAAKSHAAAEPLYEDIPIGPVTVRVTHPDKLYWPEEGITKKELIGYYRSVAPLILPYLQGRPLALNRYPDGIFGKSFRQQNVTFRTPHWVRTAKVALP